MKDVIIIGGGPAGISAALYTARAGFSTIVLENGIGEIKKAEKIENYYGFAEPISGEALYRNGITQAKRLGVQIISGQVVDLQKEDAFIVATKNDAYRAKCVVIATGSPRNTPKIKRLTDFEGRGVSYCAVCDAFFYRGKDVAVLGNGEYALHEASTLLPITKSVTILTNGEGELFRFPEQMTVVNKKIDSIDGGNRFERVIFTDQTQMAFSGLFVAYGVAGSTELARKIGAVIENNRIVTDEKAETNIEGLFAAGDCTGGIMQISKAVADGTKAGMAVIQALKKSRV